ncbi:MAG: M1 family metallopeptidase [Gemmatimonadota bacterium]|nr:M1 family metallopeptidase [Gemmatimonadota bacterium]
MTFRLRLSLALICCALASPVIAQPRYDRSGVGDTSIFAPLALRSASDHRLASGAPGSRYWQNRADYDIRATLDTASRTLRGELTLRYTNRSPDTLYFIWMQVEQNAFAGSSLNSYIFPQASRFGARGFEGGDRIERFDQRLVAAGGSGGRVEPVRTRSQETVLKVDLAEPLAPGRTATFDIAWHFLVPEHGADRMGRDGALYELAQWYPRVAVYDDVRGWNIEPYLGQGEFYLEYGDFTCQLTVPSGYIVAATGVLLNPRDVLTAVQIARLASASSSDTTVRIVTAAELASGAARPRKTGSLTWRFAARNVRDVAWAASPEYQWDASSWKGIIANAYYRPASAANWSDAADQSRMSIEEYSERWYRYPYPQISAVEGPISGMEYPMLAMENQSRDQKDLYSVVTHEIGHNWFPMIVGSNERAHMWQDEGFNTFINTFAEARRYPDGGDQMARALDERAQVEQAMVSGADRPVDVGPDRINPALLGLAAYVKPSVGLQLLRQEILGPAAFDDAFRSYIRRWAFKHPTPEDFYRTMEDVGGRRLDWFWREWFLENPRFDQAIDTVMTDMKGDTMNVAVFFGNRARGVLPIRARFSFSDGSSQELDYPTEVWSTNTVRYLRRYQFIGKRLTRIELDPDKRLVDVDRSNNVWSSQGALTP